MDCVSVVMDVEMPKMDGLEAISLKGIYENGSGAHMPIIVMTSRALVEKTAASPEAGLDDWVAKPINIEKMIQTIQRSLIK